MFKQSENGGLYTLIESNDFATSASPPSDDIKDYEYWAEFNIERVGGKIQGDVKGKRRGGADFRFVYIGDDDIMRQYIKRLEIGIDNKTYSCFIYALKVSGRLSDDTINRMNQRCLGRYLRVKDVQRLFDEFGVDAELKIYEERLYKGRHHYHILIKSRSKDPIKIGLYRDHYFIDEPSPFDIMSSDLIFKLFDDGLLRPMTVSEMPTYSIEQPSFNDLSYNPGYTLKPFEVCRHPVTLEQCRSNIKLIPRYSWKLFNNQCLKQCYKVGGIIKAFIQKGIRGARIFAVPGNYKHLTYLDINSLYSNGSI
jgi:hypothetical protein